MWIGRHLVVGRYTVRGVMWMAYAWYVGVRVHGWLWLLSRAAWRLGLGLSCRSRLLVVWRRCLIFTFARSLWSAGAIRIIALAPLARTRYLVDALQKRHPRR